MPYNLLIGSTSTTTVTMPTPDGEKGISETNQVIETIKTSVTGDVNITITGRAKRPFSLQFSNKKPADVAVFNTFINNPQFYWVEVSDGALKLITGWYYVRCKSWTYQAVTNNFLRDFTIDFIAK